LLDDQPVGFLMEKNWFPDLTENSILLIPSGSAAVIGPSAMVTSPSCWEFSTVPLVSRAQIDQSGDRIGARSSGWPIRRQDRCQVIRLANQAEGLDGR
jgi:hypothetical protein